MIAVLVTLLVRRRPSAPKVFWSLAVLVLALFAVRCSAVSRGSFYTIAACTAGVVETPKVIQ